METNQELSRRLALGTMTMTEVIKEGGERKVKLNTQLNPQIHHVTTSDYNTETILRHISYTHTFISTILGAG